MRWIWMGLAVLAVIIAFWVGYATSLQDNGHRAKPHSTGVAVLPGHAAGDPVIP